MPAPKHLTEQQRVFARSVAVHGVLIQAAREAKYSNPQAVGTRLMNNPRIAAEVERIKAQIAKKADRKTIADATEIQETLTAFVRGEYGAENETRRKSAMDLAKLQGLIVEKSENRHQVALEGMSFRELLELAKQGGDEE